MATKNNRPSSQDGTAAAKPLPFEHPVRYAIPRLMMIMYQIMKIEK